MRKVFMSLPIANVAVMYATITDLAMTRQLSKLCLLGKLVGGPTAILKVERRSWDRTPKAIGRARTGTLER